MMKDEYQQALNFLGISNEISALQAINNLIKDIAVTSRVCICAFCVSVSVIIQDFTKVISLSVT